MIFHILFQFYVFLDFRFYPLNGFFMPIKRVDFHSKPYPTPLFNLFLSLCKKISNLEALRTYIQIWILKFLFKNHFDKHQLQTHLHFFLHVCILNFFHQWLATTQFGTHGIHAHRYYFYPLCLCLIMLIQVLRITAF